MTPMTKKLLEQVETWPPEDQEELAEFAREIAARRTGVYHATPEELQAIDEALGQVARGELTSKEEVEAAFAALVRYPFKVFYTVADETVTILHIRHAARRPWAEQ